MDILSLLREESASKRKGGLYHHTQVNFAYNSNRIEGSRLSHEQTQFIYETNSFLPQNENEVIRTDDIIETLNHFKAFDYLLEVADKPLSIDIMFRFHSILKQGTSDDRNPDFVVGGYKKYANMIGASVKTTLPGRVPREMEKLMSEYISTGPKTEEDLIRFHYHFEKIHPFQDGNGRVGRLILFKECLFHKLIPFVIDNEHKLFYYRGLKNYEEEPGFLVGTCLSAQDTYKSLVDYYMVHERPMPEVPELAPYVEPLETKIQDATDRLSPTSGNQTVSCKERD